MAYRVATVERGGGTVYQLFDDATGASASVLGAFGFNLFDLRLPVAGAVRAIVDAAPDWPDKPREAGRHGTPILFPFPNRIRAGAFSFGGKSYTIRANSNANAIHGFAIQAPWDVIEHRATDQGATVTGLYQISKQSPDMLASWPADAMLQITYTLAGRKLTLDATVTNPTAHPLPYGFGIHPYYRLPFDPQGDVGKTQVILPAGKFWVLDAFLPTGEIRDVDARLDFRAGQPMTGLKLDDVLTGLGGDPRVCRLVDQSAGAEFQIRFGTNFREIVVYTPPGPGGILAVEPYTHTTDAINLQPRGIDAGLSVLAHGDRAQHRITFETVG